ncbi:hypothetical protein ALC53_06997 [Atta colombica]|uniref:Uncharacterized protein n=1 Tax=Atta colombica TaxID=520822 RepID=A0A195BE84_9HYME|nr:hypothetical protein ALC53_06997 [Atta colombica]
MVDARPGPHSCRSVPSHFSITDRTNSRRVRRGWARGFCPARSFRVRMTTLEFAREDGTAQRRIGAASTFKRYLITPHSDHGRYE